MVLADEHGALEEFIEKVYLSLFPIDKGNPLSEFLTHFTYDLIRTFSVFFVVLFFVSYLKTYISTQHIKDALIKIKTPIAVVAAVVCGLFASTCVCTNVPVFLGFIALGVPLNLAMTYLISSSLINGASLISMAAIDGIRFTGVYTVACVATAVAAGFILSCFDEKKYLFGSTDGYKGDRVYQDQKSRVKASVHELKHITKEQWVWILLGVLLAAVIDSIVNVEFVNSISGLGAWGILITTLIGVLLHTDIIAVTPVLSSFLNLKMNYGVLFSLTTSLSFFSFPMIVMLKATIKIKYILLTWAVMFILIFAAGVCLMPISQP